MIPFVGLGLKTWEEVYCSDDYELSLFEVMLNYSAPELYPFSNISSKKKGRKRKSEAPECILSN